MGDGVALTTLREHNLDYQFSLGIHHAQKLLKQIKPNEPNEAMDKIVEIVDEIDEKQQNIAKNKEKFKEDWNNGARTTKHRFTI